MPIFPNLIPFGKMTITVGGAVSLAVNSGSLEGGVGGTQASPNRMGQTLRRMILTADKANTNQIYLLPRGNSLAANPGNVIVALVAGASITLQSDSAGFIPENYCWDTDTGGNIAWGCGIPG